MELLNQLRNSYLVVPIVIILTILAIFIDSRVNNKIADKKDYINAVLFTSLLTAIVVFINSEAPPIKSEQILKGPAPF